MPGIHGLIVAAGMGARMGSLTRDTNKCLLDIEGKPLIGHTIERFKEAGIQPITVMTGYKNGQVSAAVMHDALTIFNPFYKISGVAACVWQARHILYGKAFVFSTGDHLFSLDALDACMQNNKDVHIVIKKHKHYDKESSKVILDKNQIVYFGKDISSRECGGEWTSLAFFSETASAYFFDEIKNTLSSGDTDSYLMNIFNVMHMNKLCSFTYSVVNADQCIEIDTESDLSKAREIINKLIR